MTSYTRKPNTFDELLIESTTDYQDVATFFGQSYNANLFALNGAGWIQPGLFVVHVSRSDAPNGTELVYANTGNFLRAERRGDGATVNLTYSVDSLATDANFTAES